MSYNEYSEIPGDSDKIGEFIQTNSLTGMNPYWVNFILDEVELLLLLLFFVFFISLLKLQGTMLNQTSLTRLTGKLRHYFVLTWVFLRSSFDLFKY